MLEGIDVNFWASIVIKLIVVTVLASVIGLERESNNKPAGFRTHILVGISAVLVMICGKSMHDITGGDATRIPAQLLSGIGFLGAGTILRNGYSVRGLTTAASLLATTCIGMAIGAGLYSVGVISTILVFIVLEYTQSIGDKFERKSLIKINVKLNNPKENLNSVTEILENYTFEVSEIKIVSENELTISGLLKDDFNKSKILYKLMQVKDVNEVVEIDNDKD